MRFPKAKIFTAFFLAMIIFCDGHSVFSEEKLMPSSTSFILNHPNLSRKVTLALNDTNIVDALVYLSEKAEINVAVSKTVQGRATLSLNNVSIRDALEIILISNELACEKRGEIFYVMPASDYESIHGERWSEVRQARIFKLQYAKPADVTALLQTVISRVGNVVSDNDSGTVVVMDTPEKLEQVRQTVETVDKEMLTRVFNLKYANAADVVANLQPRLDAKGLGSAKADDKYNRVIVYTLPGKMDEIEKVVIQLDAKIKQVLIEAKIVRVALTPEFEFGVDWQRLIQRELITVDSHFPFNPTTTFGQVVIGKLGKINIDAIMKFLKTVGETKLLSSPRITALNNEEAKIFVGTKEVYTTSSTTTATAGNTTATTVNFLDVGIQLKVTPVINDDGFVLMKIRPEVSRVDHFFETPEGDKIPVVDTTNAETRVMVKDGNVIIIGGLIRDETTSDTDKFPGLGDLPILGNAFKHVHETRNKSELVVFLTPHIIDAEKDMTQFDTKQTKPLKGYDDEKNG